ncbi:MAG: hypothetical protein WCS42_28435 [Verrucomicrobiota bacterium]
MKSVKFECPTCQQVIECPATMAGEQLQCPSCGKGITAPGARIIPVSLKKRRVVEMPPGTIALISVFIIFVLILIGLFRQYREDNLVSTLSTAREPSATPMLLLLVWGVLGSSVGFLIGRSRGKQRLGAALGIALGPIGWLITLCTKDLRPRCQECGGVVFKGAKKCLHCGSKIEKILRICCPSCGETGYAIESAIINDMECPTCMRVSAATSWLNG